MTMTKQAISAAVLSLAAAGAANALEITLDAGGIKLSAAEPIGVVRVSYPRIYDAAQKEEGPSKVYVTNRCAHLYYRNGTSAQLFAGDGGEMTLTYSNMPTGNMKISHTIGLDSGRFAGKAKWSIADSPEQVFPSEKKSDGFLFRGDALKLRISADGSEGFGVDIPFGYQELQDQRAWGLRTFRWNSFSHLPAEGKYVYHIVSADGSKASICEGSVTSTEEIYVPYPDAGNEALWPGKGPIRTFGWQDGIRRNYFNRRAADENAIVFVGDSLTENWRTLAKDFPDLKVANRGVGGDTSRGILFRIEHDVLPLRPQVVVMCAGANDLTAHGNPSDTLSNIEDILAILRKYNGKMPVVLCTIPPSSNPKAPLKPGARDAVNNGIKEIAEKYGNITLLDLSAAVSDENGVQRLELFSSDRLHLGPKGYVEWKAALQKIFDKMFAPATPVPDVKLDLSKFKLIWSDEFDGDSIDTNKWDMPTHIRQGASRWNPENVSVADGKVTIKVKRTNDPVYRYESACIRTSRGYEPEDRLFGYKYGYIEASLRLPRHIRTDYWVGFWLLAGDVVKGRNDDTRIGTEIDIIETFDYWNLGYMKHTLHWGGYGKLHNAQGFRSGPHIRLLDDKFHTYGLYWDENRYVFFIDGVAVCETDAMNLGGSGKPGEPKSKSRGTCRGEAYIKLSIEGAPWCGPTSNWEKDMPEEDSLQCDYIRVYSGTL